METKKITIIINNKNAKLYNNDDAKVYYYESDRKYEILGMGNVLLKNIDNVEILKINKKLDLVKEIKYKGKIYKVEQTDSSKENRDDTIYINGTLEEFFEKFDSEIVYDFENGKVYISVK